jgi:hypothetical protein
MSALLTARPPHFTDLSHHLNNMNGSYALFVSTITTLITQLFNTFWTLFTRAFSILTRSSATPPPTDLPIAVPLRLVVNVGSEPTFSGHAQRHPREQGELSHVSVT